MATTSKRNPDNIRKLLDKYKNNRAMTGKKDRVIASRSDVLNQVSVNEDMMKEVMHQCNDEKSIHVSLQEIHGSESLSDLPEAKDMIEDSASLLRSTEKLRVHFDESSVEEIDNTTHHVIQTANDVAQTLQSSTPTQLGAMMNAVTEILNNAAAATAAGAACIKAYRNLDFHRWLTDTLVNRKELQEHLENLNHIYTGIDPLPNTLESLERKIWQSDLFEETQLKIGKIKKMPVEEYHEMLMEYFDKFGENTDDLTPKEEKVIEKHHDYIQDDNIISIISALEKRHIRTQLDKCEDLLHTRLVADFVTQKDLEKTISILNTYTSKHDSKGHGLLSKTLLSAKNGTFNKDVSKEEIENAIRKDNDIQKNLEKKAISKRNSLIARTLILAAAALVAAIAIVGIIAVSFAVPGLGPVLAGLGVAATACTITAYLIKPEIFKDIKNDFSSGMKKIMRYYNHEKKKDKIKNKAKKDHSLFHQSEKDTSPHHPRGIPHPNHHKR
jgi:hypothetical protein